jgi:enolase
MILIESVRAWPILDSRGNWTIACEIGLRDGSVAQAHVPAGASTGRHEAVALPAKAAAANVNTEIREAIVGRPADVSEIDRRLIALDGTPDKSRLGANALLGVSCALARAISISRRQPLWATLRELFNPSQPAAVPMPMINILSGGLHAGGNIEFQDFLIIPAHAGNVVEALESAVDIHRSVRAELLERGYMLTGVADEGGWGPRLGSNEEAIEILSECIQRSGRDIRIAVDVASTQFYDEGRYHLGREGRTSSSQEMIDLVGDWSTRFPLFSVEDGLAEDDWEGWVSLTSRLGSRLQLVGDDLFTTNLGRLERGIEIKAANAVLVKMNQIGTLTETFAVIERAHRAGYRCVISARSGETEDHFLADLATASGAGQIKIGSITRSERLAKYNRMIELQETLHFAGITA